MKGENEMKIAAAFEMIRTSPIGTALQVELETDRLLTVLLAREKSSIIEWLKSEPREISFRQAMFDVDNVILIATLFSVREGDIFEVWWNFFNLEHRNCITRMSEQDFLDFHFVGDSLQTQYTMHTVNGAKEFFWEAIHFIQNKKEWSMEDYETARQKVYELYPSPNDIWGAIEKSSHLKLNPRGGTA